MDIKSTADKLLKGDVSGVVDDVKSTIKRSLTLVGVIIVTVAASIGSGLFVLPSFAASVMGPGIWLAFLLAGIVFLPGALSKSELASAMPVNGGAYVYLERSFGPIIGTISGLGLWASFLLKSAFALIGFSAYMYAVTNYLDISTNATFVIMSALALITILNIFGIKKVKAFQTPILALTTILILVICFIQLFDASFDFSRPIDGAFDVSRDDPVLVAEAAALVFVAYAGIYKAGALGGEIKEPKKNLPAGMLLSLLLITLLYVVVTFIMMGAVEGEWWVNSDGSPREDPIFAFVDAVASTEIGIAMALLAFLTMISGALSGLLAASRFLFAMAKDCLLPDNLSETNEKFGTPHWSIIITGVAMGICILTLPVKDVAKLASGFQIMVIVALNACVIILRRENQKHEWYQPEFKSPLYPFVQVFGIIAGAILVYLMGSKAIIGALAAIVLGLSTYKIYGEKNYKNLENTSLESE
ncbi:MAG TPA: amino acid permease [Candidatus Poseidoniaceae archaeon]|nr:MAG TPA: amino acid permease [Candidatus Poseidoniales archaeon]DAC57785.1 MAG TPA: amino acid permease [Candidatus Poseidoniales archaeon]HII23396.1 amino acid permease [Candidatus Poseidoniaceae archaeon]HII51021.1 amino acid permease [Candidatus Poseidoniaceae archaeon]|tara:strand:+ start:1074 stop:2492 length:1419 start_codon:yes stop_codon:yes gene_type:complete